MQPPHGYHPSAHPPPYPQHAPGPGHPPLPFHPGAPLGYHGPGPQAMLPPYQTPAPFPVHGQGAPFGMAPPGPGYGHPAFAFRPQQPLPPQGPFPPQGQFPPPGPFAAQGPMLGHPEGRAGGAFPAHPHHPGSAGALGGGGGPPLGGGGGGRGRAWGPGPGSFRGGAPGGPSKSGGRGRGGRGGAGSGGRGGAGPGGRAGRWGRGDAQRRFPSAAQEPQRPSPGPARDPAAGGAAAPTPAPPHPAASLPTGGPSQRGGSGGSFACQPCEREFNAEATLQAHLQTHEGCPEPGCSFSAPGRRLKEHKATVHGKVTPATSVRAVKAAQFRARESAEQVQRWLEERRKNFPSTANLERKAKEAQERKERGELAAADDALTRRKRLREVLDMQAQLGLPMCEIPPHYLADSGAGGRGGRGPGRGMGPSERGRGSLRGGRGRGMEQGPGGWPRGGGRSAEFRGRGRMGRGTRGGRWTGEWQGRGAAGGGGWEDVGLVASSSRRLDHSTAAASPVGEGTEGAEGEGGAPAKPGRVEHLEGVAEGEEAGDVEHGEDWDVEEEGTEEDGEPWEGQAWIGDEGEGPELNRGQGGSVAELAGPASSGECAVLALGAVGARQEPCASELRLGSAQPSHPPPGSPDSGAPEEMPVTRVPDAGAGEGEVPEEASAKRKREEMAREAVSPGAAAPAAAAQAQGGPGSRPLCVYFQRGHCRRGRTCHFSHAAPPGVAPAVAQQEGSSRGGDARSAGGGRGNAGGGRGNAGGERGNAGGERGNAGGGRGGEEKGVEQIGDLEAWSPWERRPSLLARLLEKDIREEQSQSLQAIRFLVNNDFLLAYPYKPLATLHWATPDAKGSGETPTH